MRLGGNVATFKYCVIPPLCSARTDAGIYSAHADWRLFHGVFSEVKPSLTAFHASGLRYKAVTPQLDVKPADRRDVFTAEVVPLAKNPLLKMRAGESETLICPGSARICLNLNLLAP